MCFKQCPLNDFSGFVYLSVSHVLWKSFIDVNNILNNTISILIGIIKKIQVTKSTIHNNKIPIPNIMIAVGNFPGFAYLSVSHVLWKFFDVLTRILLIIDANNTCITTSIGNRKNIVKYL